MNDTPEPAETSEKQASKPLSGRSASAAAPAKEKLKEIGGPKGPEPTRFGDWERKGRCIDF